MDWSSWFSLCHTYKQDPHAARIERCDSCECDEREGRISSWLDCTFSARFFHASFAASSSLAQRTAVTAAARLRRRHRRRPLRASSTFAPLLSSLLPPSLCVVRILASETRLVLLLTPCADGATDGRRRALPPLLRSFLPSLSECDSSECFMGEKGGEGGGDAESCLCRSPPRSTMPATTTLTKTLS